MESSSDRPGDRAAARPAHSRDDLYVAQPWGVRLTHWVNVVVLPVMAGSGLQILLAFPYFGPRGSPFAWFPLQGWEPPAVLRIGGWLAGARHVHFAFAWALIGNALVYLVYLFSSGEWRRRLYSPRRDTRQAVAMALHYLRLRGRAPQNALRPRDGTGTFRP